MIDMQLPLRPATFAAFYLFLTALSVTPTLLGWPGSPYVAWLGISALISLHCLWVMQLAEVAAHGSGQQGAAPAELGRLPAIVRVLAFVPPATLALSGFYWNIARTHASPNIASFVDMIINPLGAAASVAFFIFLWFAAKMFCDSERNKNLEPHSVFGTFLLVLYAVIGAAFIYPRVKRLEESQ